MVVCSYETLARYDDDCTRKTRARSIDDIRDKTREILIKLRQSTKVIKMLHNRPSLVEVIRNNEDCDVSSLEDGSSNNDSNAWLTDPSVDSANCWSNPPPSPPPQSQSIDTPLTIETAAIPNYFFETPETSRHASPGGRSSRASPPLQRQRLYKNSKNLSKKSSAQANSIMVRKQFDELIDSIVQCQRDPMKIGQQIILRWQVMVNSLKSYEESVFVEALGLLKSLIRERLLQSKIILHMFQHGLLSAIRDQMRTRMDGVPEVIELLLMIAQATPGVIPYMVEVIVRSPVLADFEERILAGTTEHVSAVMNFYYYITERMFSYLYIDTQNDQPQILIPDILLITGVSKHTLQSFSPASTISKLISTNLIRYSVKNVLNKYFQKENELISRTLVVLANVIKLIHYRTATETLSEEITTWLARLLAVFRDSQIESKIQDLNKAFDRLIDVCDSSEHFSQGIGVGDAAARSKEQCLQFISFYIDQHAALSRVYETWMNKWEIGYRTPQESDSSEADSCDED